MKVLITFTLFTEDLDYIQHYVNIIIVDYAKNLNYQIMKFTTGKHLDANRPHYHICVLMDTNGNKKYKILNEKIKRTNITLYKNAPHPLPDEKISFMYEGETQTYKGKAKKYDETALQYPFKEYKTYSDIPIVWCYGFSGEELEMMRKCANIEWNAKKRYENQQELKEKEKKTELETMNEFIEKHLKETTTLGSEIVVLLPETIKAILLYKKLNKSTSIRLSSLKDTAVSYLYYNNRITEQDIIDNFVGKLINY